MHQRRARLARARVHGLESGARQLLSMLLQRVWRALVQHICLAAADARLAALLCPAATPDVQGALDSGIKGVVTVALPQLPAHSLLDARTCVGGPRDQELRSASARMRSGINASRPSGEVSGGMGAGPMGLDGGCYSQECQMERSAMHRNLEELSQQLAACQAAHVQMTAELSHAMEQAHTSHEQAEQVRVTVWLFVAA